MAGEILLSTILWTLVVVLGAEGCVQIWGTGMPARCRPDTSVIAYRARLDVTA